MKIGNLYEKKGQNGEVYTTDGVSPALRSGQGLHGRGIGSNNAPKIIEYETEDTTSHEDRICRG